MADQTTQDTAMVNNQVGADRFEGAYPVTIADIEATMRRAAAGIGPGAHRPGRVFHASTDDFIKAMKARCGDPG